MSHAHERMRVYSRAIEATAILHRVAAGIPDACRDLRDQLRRAAASVPLNIAEGAGESSPAEKARSTRMARRSAVECSAILDVVESVAPSNRWRFDEPRRGLDEICGMLTAMTRTMAARSRDGGSLSPSPSPSPAPSGRQA